MEIDQEVEDDGRRVDDMEEVEHTGISATQQETQVSVTVVKDSLESDNSFAPSSHPLSSPKDVIQSTVIQTQPALSTAQDESTPTQYSNSTPSIVPKSSQDPSQIVATQDDSQQRSDESQIPSSKEQQTTPTIPSTQPSILPRPPLYLPSRHFSPPRSTPSYQIYPPKATPGMLVPASAQIQVTETPPPAQRPAQQPLIPFASSTTPITATALSPAKRPPEPVKRKHRRERHIGPIVPKFSLQERKMKWDLQAILLEDRKKFQESLPPVSSGNAEVEEKKDTIMKEVDVIEDGFKEEKPVEKVNEPEKPSVPEKPAAKAVEPEEKKIMVTRLFDIPKLKRSPLSLVDDTQDDSQTSSAAQSRWGRFANHWRRFSSSP